MPRKSYYERHKQQLKQQRQESDFYRKKALDLRSKLLHALPQVLMSYEDFRAWNTKATWRNYYNELVSFDKRQRITERKSLPKEFLIHKYPIKGEDCLKFRYMILEHIARDTFFLAGHDCGCESCNSWRIRENMGSLKGARLW